MRTAINLYSVRDLDEPTSEVLERVAAAGYDGVQFSGDHTPEKDDPEAIADALDEFDLDAAPAHIPITTLEEDLAATVDTYESVDVDGAVIPSLSADYYQDRDVAQDAADRLNAVHDDLRAASDWSFHYHNHAREFNAFDGTTGFDVLLAETDILMELDVGWARAAGVDPVRTIRDLGERAEVLHMKDMKTEVEGDAEFAEIGEGDVDMLACAEAAKDAGTEWLIYEHDMPEDAAASLATGGAYLSDLLDRL
ncbi:MAG: sugar phosphate isomerase/epimerase family protein [Halobacteriaceae archaeon]